jgi:hypothetical protein
VALCFGIDKGSLDDSRKAGDEGGRVSLTRPPISTRITPLSKSTGWSRCFDCLHVSIRAPVLVSAIPLTGFQRGWAEAGPKLGRSWALTARAAPCPRSPGTPSRPLSQFTWLAFNILRPGYSIRRALKRKSCGAFAKSLP